MVNCLVVGRTFYCFGKSYGNVKIWSTADGALVHDFQDNDSSIFCMAWSSDGKYMATASRDGKVRIFGFKKIDLEELFGDVKNAASK